MGKYTSDLMKGHTVIQPRARIQGGMNNLVQQYS